jgi:hypothetical protein
MKKMKRFVENYSEFIKREMGYTSGDSMDMDDAIEDMENALTEMDYVIEEAEYLLNEYVEKNPDSISVFANQLMFGKYDVLKSIITDIKNFYESVKDTFGYLVDFNFYDKTHISVLENLIRKYMDKHNIKLKED